MKLSKVVLGLAAVTGALTESGEHQMVKRAQLTQVQNFGTNPSGIKMFIYVPASLKANPPVVLVLHACAWTAQSFFGTTKYGQFADQYGYVLIYGQTPTDGACWDVSSDQTLKHDGGSDSTGLANMVRYALKTYNGDASRVFVTGESSGAMMTQVMAAAYPDIFAAASEFSGEPAGCFSTGTVRGWNSQCAGGQVHKSASEWATIVHNMYPGYTGQYPKMQVFHGDVDTTLNIASFNESVKEWSGVFGYSGNALSYRDNDPGTRLTRYIYGDRLQGIWGHGFGHVVPTNETEALQWFGIMPGGSQPTSTTTTSRPSSTKTTGSSPTGSAVAQYGQCGGLGYTGSTTCQSPYKCTYSNDYYSQCL
ncbi:Alpha/Beta hydrolase protein [Xylariaceae sp. FL1651]|nr:Alpha/Beta hydrolase protein [Xylariaceae sp. FL1651]